MGVDGDYPGRAVIRHVPFPVEQIDSLAFKMSAFHQDRRRAESRNPDRRLYHIVHCCNTHSGQFSRFSQIGSDEESSREQEFGQSNPGPFGHQRLAVLAYHHRINNKRKRELLRLICNQPYDLLIAERPRLCSRRRDVLQHRIELCSHQFAIDNPDSADPARILNGQQCDDTRPVDPPLMKGLEIRLNAGAS